MNYRWRYFGAFQLGVRQRQISLRMNVVRLFTDLLFYDKIELHIRDVDNVPNCTTATCTHESLRRLKPFSNVNSETVDHGASNCISNTAPSHF